MTSRWCDFPRPSFPQPQIQADRLLLRFRIPPRKCGRAWHSLTQFNQWYCKLERESDTNWLDRSCLPNLHWVCSSTAWSFWTISCLHCTLKNNLAIFWLFSPEVSESFHGPRWVEFFPDTQLILIWMWKVSLGSYVKSLFFCPTLLTCWSICH